jgi:hypothetical protein
MNVIITDRTIVPAKPVTRFSDLGDGEFFKIAGEYQVHLYVKHSVLLSSAMLTKPPKVWVALCVDSPDDSYSKPVNETFPLGVERVCVEIIVSRPQ